ncbi:MAG: right-handed parallel beta-helix repeat-containing protein [Chitinispirillaceae bacterium]|nr:right-handed parallel beta-helix repeat-containing protein [Chitinispirillaceae bacterium]
MMLARLSSYTASFLSVLLAAVVAAAGNIHIVPDGSGVGDRSGRDWANAFDGFPPPSAAWWGSAVGGDTLFVSGGTYSENWEIPIGGNAQPLLIRRATALQHGSDEGWQEWFDSTVVIKDAGILLHSGNITVDGAVEGGIWILVAARNPSNGVELDKPGNHLVLRRLRIQGPGYNDPNPTRGIDCTPSGGTSTGLLVDSCIIYDLSSGIYTLRFDSVIVQHSVIHDIHNGADIHENAWYSEDCNHCIFRYNIVYNSSSEGVFIRSTQNDWVIHNNLFYNSNYGVATKEGFTHTAIVIYNNTFANLRVPIVLKDPTDVGVVKNNLIVPDESGIGYTGQTVHDFNYYGGSSTVDEPNGVAGMGVNPFVDTARHDYRLRPGTAPVEAGVALDSTFRRDLAGILRPRGRGWDIGALEFDAPGGFISFEDSLMALQEEGGTATVRILRWGANAGSVGVSLSVINGTAMQGVDFQCQPGRIEFAVGDTLREFVVTAINNADSDGVRSAQLWLHDADSSAALAYPKILTLLIMDDERINHSPEAPRLLAPQNGAVIGDSMVDFSWSKCKDPDGDSVAYHLQVAMDSLFSTVVLNHTVPPSGSCSAAVPAMLLGAWCLSIIPFWKRRRRTKARGCRLAAGNAAILLMVLLLQPLCRTMSKDNPAGISPSDRISIRETLPGKGAYFWRVQSDDRRGGTAISETRKLLIGQ